MFSRRFVPRDHKLKNRTIFFPRRARSFVSHCQMVITRQPHLRSSRLTRLSRSRFLPIFRCQNSVLDVGALPRAQVCPCQKQPLTKTMLFHLGRTMSGQPGSSFTCSLNRYPRPCNSFLTRISGAVFLAATAAIAALRCFGVRVSTKCDPTLGSAP